jgi:hypothetical protein
MVGPAPSRNGAIPGLELWVSKAIANLRQQMVRALMKKIQPVLIELGFIVGLLGFR